MAAIRGLNEFFKTSSFELLSGLIMFNHEETKSANVYPRFLAPFRLASWVNLLQAPQIVPSYDYSPK
jgi:hypothetical protein